MKKLPLLLFVFCFVWLQVLNSQVPPPPLFPGETYTQLYSAAYDFQGNGSVRIFVQDPANPNYLFAVMMGILDSNQIPPSVEQRRTYYAYSFDNGATWFSNNLTNNRSGFPGAAIIGGVPAVVLHEVLTQNVVKVYRDLLFGVGAFEELVPPVLLPNGTWAGITGSPASQNMLVVASVNNAGGPYPVSRINYNGSAWGTWQQIPPVTGTSGCHSLFSGPGGLTGIAGFCYDSAQVSNTTAPIYYLRSTNFGSTFDTTQRVYKWEVMGNGDTTYHSVECGMQGIYYGSEPHIIFGVYGTYSQLLEPNGLTDFTNCKILHWSPSTGITTVADKTNSPSITDTVLNTLMSSRCQPSIGRLADGTLICAFAGFPRGQSQLINGENFNTADIYLSYSRDTGRTWLGPINYTNTPNLEEKSPSVLPSSSDNTIRMVYFRDKIAGYSALNSSLPKSPYYCIMKKSSLTALTHNNETPVKFELQQNYPNPFNPETRISYSLGEKSLVTLKVYDITGREVSVLVNSEQGAGDYDVNFNAGKLSTGIYFYTITTGSYTDTKKMVLIK